jgi:hypothetical protein
VIVEKTSTNSVNKKFKDPCSSLIYKGLQFKVVVPPGIKQLEIFPGSFILSY